MKQLPVGKWKVRYGGGREGNKRYIIKMVSQKSENSTFFPLKIKLEIRMRQLQMCAQEKVPIMILIHLVHFYAKFTKSLEKHREGPFSILLWLGSD